VRRCIPAFFDMLSLNPLFDRYHPHVLNFVQINQSESLFIILSFAVSPALFLGVTTIIISPPQSRAEEN